MNEPNEGVSFTRCQSVDPGHDDHPRLFLGEQQMLLRRHHLIEVNVDKLKPSSSAIGRSSSPGTRPGTARKMNALGLSVSADHCCMSCRRRSLGEATANI